MQVETFVRTRPLDEHGQGEAQPIGRLMLPKPAPLPRPDATDPLAGFYRPGSAPCRCSDCSGGELPAVASAGRYL
jgi:hypothetical protein